MYTQLTHKSLQNAEATLNIIRNAYTAAPAPFPMLFARNIRTIETGSSARCRDDPAYSRMSAPADDFPRVPAFERQRGASRESRRRPCHATGNNEFRYLIYYNCAATRRSAPTESGSVILYISLARIFTFTGSPCIIPRSLYFPLASGVS